MTEFPSPYPAYLPAAVRRHSLAADGREAVDEPSAFADDVTEPEADDDGDRPSAREGLPPSFRMRHESHYVDAMFGESRPATASSQGGRDATPAADRATLAAAVGVVVESLETVARVLDAVPRRGRPLHDRVALDLVRAEATRARWVADAVAVMHADLLPALDEVDLVTTVSAVLDGFAFEDRLAGLAPTSRPHGTCRVFGDPHLLHTAVAALVLATRTLAASRGDTQRIGVSFGSTGGQSLRVVRVEQWAVRVPAASLDRFFDGGWAGHPAGAGGAVLLAAARRIALAQGGDVVAEPHASGGCALLLRLPPAD